MWLPLLLLAVAMVLAAGAFVVLRRKPRPARECRPHDYAAPPPAGTWEHHRFDPGPALYSDAWRAELNGLGARMRAKGVRRVVFVHGTFVGTDPVSLFDVIGRLLAGAGDEVAAVLKTLKVAPARLVTDLGNWTAQYVSLVERGLGIPCLDFRWSSANHHLSRLRAAVSLAHVLAAEKESGRLLLIGHSHAGQVFSLLLQMVTGAKTAPALIDAAVKDGAQLDTLHADLRRLARRRFDIVTFGTPTRYGWTVDERHRLLHVINHRGDEPRGGGPFSGFLSTQDGDYVQQWGICGSDLVAGSERERELNQRLDEILGCGTDRRAWLAYVRHRRRIADAGRTFLVDYGDRGGLVPNCLGTLFGHGVYTTHGAMLFNLRLISSFFY
jgi:hypothetical protein